MRSSLCGLIALELIALTGFSPAVPSAPELDSTHTPTLTVTADTVHVAPPTGEKETDRASILAALEEVEPGGTILFPPGMYLVGTIMLVPQSGITLQAHPSGTTLRGCHPGEAGESVLDCGVMLLQGGGVTLRGFTIEQSQLGVCVSACRGDPQAPVGDTVGGYRIEDNTFRNSLNGVRGQVVSSDTSVIRDNRFINTFHAVSFLEASNLHVVDNRISAPAPAEMPGLGHVSFAITVSGSSNLIARNRIEGHPDGILLGASPGFRTSGNAIRGNTIAVARHRLPDGGSPALASSDSTDSTIVGVPLALHGLRAPGDTTEAGRLSDNLVKDNRILGAEGIGIELTRASGNRILGNHVSGIVSRRPFPGNSVSTDPAPWREANGSGIWVSPGSDENEIVGNTFEDVEVAVVFLEGDDNRVFTRSPKDEVRDRGTGNDVSAADGAEGSDVAPEERGAGETDTVHVAPPTGEQETDRASILAALERVEPGGTVLFAPGTYLVGEIIHVTVPGISVVGHPDGTTLRGCHPDMFPRQGGMEEMFVAVVSCNGLDMASDHQTVRGLTFEYAWHALVLGGMECMEGRGCVPVLQPVESRSGGYRVEDNTFRNTAIGIRTLGQWSEPAVIRGNRFINTLHAVVVHGSIVHVVENDISVPEPERVPAGHPGTAMIVSATDLNLEAELLCAGNVIAGNRIRGHPDGIAIMLLRAGVSCRDNVIRQNTIAVERVQVTASWWGVTHTESDSSAVGIPMALINEPKADPEMFDSAEVDEQEGVLEGNLIEGNVISGAEGIGIELLHASGNRIVNNTITGVARRDPFPGIIVNGFDPQKSGWREANGSGIWVSPGSDENEIRGNTFQDLASYAVVLEGDSNRVALRRATDSVRDLGSGNEVTRPDGDGERPPEEQTSDTVRVAPPTGDAQEDRAAILEALEAAGPGGTLRFGPGTYVTGDARITLTTPGVTLVGDADGTVIRGCDRATLDTLDVATMRQGRCAGLFWLQGGRQAIRSMTLEGVHTALDLGWIAGEGDAPVEDGGYGVEDVTFRRVSKGVNVMGQWAEVATIRDNRFLNVYHAITLQGGTSHVLDNDITAPEPGTVFYQGFPGGAISAIAAPECGENVIAGNRIEGHPEGIIVGTLFPGTSCRNNMIRNNVVDVRRVTFGSDAPGRSLINVEHEDDRTVTGVPITILNAEGEDGVPAGAPPEWQGPAFSGNHVIEDNRVLGAGGLGIQIRRSSGNRVADNSIEAVVRREPFPGNHLHLHPEPWEPANGSGIWVSPGSEDNEIVGNTFEDVAGAEVFLEGDGNRVILRGATDSVLDLGTGNRVPEPASETLESRFGPTGPDPWPSDVPPGDTARYTVIINGHPKVEWRVWQEDSDTWRYEYEGEEYDSYHFPRSERLVLDSDGLPVELEIMGQKSPWAAWEERFEGEGGVARWTTTVDEGEHLVDGPRRYYAALHPVHDRGVLVRALLRRSSGRLPLLPEGEARIEALGERSIATEKGTRTVRHYAVHGLDLKPAYVWLDESGATFADEWSVLSGWEAAFPELRAATEEALAEYHRGLARSVVPPSRERPFAITGARLFDPETHGVRAGTTILIDGTRIAAVGPDGSVEAPPGAEVIEAAGRMVLPGLWDMHAHHGIPSVYLELDAPLHLAGGITTARDLGSHTEPILSLKERIEAGRAIGPRLLLAGFIEGAGGRPSGVLVGSAAEAEAAVDRFAELGFVQIKIYGQIPGELVPVVIERAVRHGLRVSGHITDSMSGRDAVEAGYDEIQHIAGIMNGMLGSSAELRERVDDGWTGWSEALADLQPGSETVREFVELLVARGVAIDPTLAGTEASDVPPDYVAPVLDRLPPQARRRILDRFWIPHPESLPHQDGIVLSGRGFVRAAHEAGVPVLPGTDIIPGFGYHRELELYVEAGIPAPEVLTLATLGAARVMGMDDELGSIRPGKLADLILVDGDPTTDISDIRRVTTVIKDGRVYDPAAIYRALGIAPCCQE